MRLLFVADGPRDQATVPEIVQRVLNSQIDPAFQAWRHLHLAGSGYPRKLRFVLIQARDAGFDGVVATVDTDNGKPRDRLKSLGAARIEDRKNPSWNVMPAALGEATPHLEAWLLGDPKAIRDVLQFPNDKEIPGAQCENPKVSLDELIRDSERTDERMGILSEIARSITVERCNHSSETGFREFVEDVGVELNRRDHPSKSMSR